MKLLKIKKNDSGQRLDKFLTKAVKGLPMSLMYKYIRTKKIKLNGKRAEQSTILAEGDEVMLYIRDEFFDSPSKDEGALTRIKSKLTVVYEDENILLIDKRAGVLVHEDKADNENTLIMHIKAYLYGKGEYDPENEQSFAPALCNRIDRNTGGIVIAAKNAAALREMNELIREDLIRKFYLCAVHGVMKGDGDTLHGWLIKNNDTNTVRVYDRQIPGSREIITKYRVLSYKDDSTLLEVELVTGRTHQIRAHMAHIGYPLLGDGKYGQNREDKHDGYKYQALYSYRLRYSSDVKKYKTLGYLAGREFSVDKNNVWFYKEFSAK